MIRHVLINFFLSVALSALTGFIVGYALFIN